MSVANGTVRVSREREFTGNLDDARKLVVANAWSVAKAIKDLPLDTDQRTLESIVDLNFNRRSSNMKGIEDIL
jgi:hypothetical protein